VKVLLDTNAYTALFRGHEDVAAPPERPSDSNQRHLDRRHAMESGADLLSFDQPFEHVEGLAWIRPDRPK
jgi:hypothetical protein